MAKKLFCDICQENLQDVNGSSKVGISILFFGKHPQVERVRKMFGGKTEFHICPTCYLKRMGIQPVSTRPGEISSSIDPKKIE